MNINEFYLLLTRYLWKYLMEKCSKLFSIHIFLSLIAFLNSPTAVSKSSNDAVVIIHRGDIINEMGICAQNAFARTRQIIHTRITIMGIMGGMDIFWNYTIHLLQIHVLQIHLLQIHLLQIHLLQIHVLQIHLLQIYLLQIHLLQSNFASLTTSHSYYLS